MVLMHRAWRPRIGPRCGVLRLLRIAVLSCVCGLSALVDAATPTVAGQLALLEDQGRARPEEAAAQIHRLLPPLSANSPERVHALELLGTLLATMSDSDGNERVAVQLDALASQATAVSARAGAAAGLVRAKLLDQTGPMLRADRLMTEAMARLPNDTPPAERLPYLLLSADVKSRAGKLDDAVRLGLKALALADASGLGWQRVQSRTALAYTLYQAGQKDRALTLDAEALQLAEKAGDQYSLSQASTNRAILLSEDRDGDSELLALRAAIDHAKQAGAKRSVILGLANLADFYLIHADYATALEMSERALPMTREIKSPGYESLALANTGLAMISLHREDEGMRVFSQALAIEERSGSVPTMADYYQELGKYLEKAGDLPQAFEADRQHRRLADDVFHQEQQQTILEMQESFDNERRNRELELLNRQNRLNEEELLQHELQQRLWGMGAALSLLTFGVIVLLVQRGRRANRQLASTNEQLKVQSELDPLTGLANRRHLQQAMRLMAPDNRLVGTAFLLDIDHFKHINDEHGHGIGDAVLVEIARRLRATLREPDLIVRWGGEEFLVVVRALSPEQVDALAQRLLDAMASEPVTVESHAVVVSASIGFATFPLEPDGIGLPWERAIEVVDTAMYLAKAHGRNRAYGVRLLHVADESEIDATVKTLEQSWREGRVALTLLQGPASGNRGKA